MAKSWSGPLAPIGKPTGDGRMFAEGAITNRDCPLPLRFQRLDNPGHAGAVVVGRILRVEYRDGEIFGKGDWLDPETTPEVTEAQALSAKGVIGPSVDLDDATVEKLPIEPEAEQELAKAGEDCGCSSGVDHSAETPTMSVVTAGRISGATLVQIPAFAEVKSLSLSDDEYLEEVDQLTASVWAGTATTGDPVIVESEDTDGEDLHAYLVQFSDDGETAEVVYDDGSFASVAAWRVGPAREDERRAWEQALTAAAARVCPPKSWFADPKFKAHTPMTITEDGRVFGHLAPWGACHLGFQRECVTAPPSKTGYAYFHTGAVETAEGDLLPVGRITLGTGHPAMELNYASAAEHYDNTGTAVAVVRAGEDQHGIWVAGSLVSDATPERVAEFRRSPLSGDWREVGGHLELVAALAVNTPGFAVTRTRVASGRPMTLIAGADFEKKHKRGFGGKFVDMVDKVFPGTSDLRRDRDNRKSDRSTDRPSGNGPRGGGDRSSEFEGPSRGDNLRRLRELEAKADSDDGISGAEAEELAQLRQIRIESLRDKRDRGRLTEAEARELAELTDRRSNSRGMSSDRVEQFADQGYDLEYAEEMETFGALTHDARMSAAKAGNALPDGSFPIRNVRELEKAIQAYGRAKDKPAARHFIMKRARELKREDLIPEQWRKNPESYGVDTTTNTYNTADGVTVHLVIDGDMIGRTLEEQFKKMKRRRDMYAEAESAFAVFEADRAEERVETAAALLEVIGGE